MNEIAEPILKPNLRFLSLILFTLLLLGLAVWNIGSLVYN
jgi:hypothetical protein